MVKKSSRKHNDTGNLSGDEHDEIISAADRADAAFVHHDDTSWHDRPFDDVPVAAGVAVKKEELDYKPDWLNQALSSGGEFAKYAKPPKAPVASEIPDGPERPERSAKLNKPPRGESSKWQFRQQLEEIARQEHQNSDRGPTP